MMRSQTGRFVVAPLLALAMLGTCTVAGPARADDYDPPGRVAHVNLLEGSGELQPAGAEEWVGDLLNRPLSGGDKLWIDERSRAEMHVGSIAVRLGASTALQVLVVDDRNVRLRVTSGSISVRVRELDRDDRIDIETPAGQVSIEQPGGYRLDVDDREEQTRVAVWSGQAAVTGRFGTGLVHSNEGAELFGGEDPAVELAAAGDTDELDSWAEDRDAREDRSRAARFVSRGVAGYEELDDYGDWVVDPEYGAVWVPQEIGADWAPYRFGYWSWIVPWGWTWIDSAPWGFAPCHYGRWVHARHGWAWAPGGREERRPVFAPALVAWRGGPGPDRDRAYQNRADHDHAPSVGWVPLGYNEVYEPAYRASPNYLRAVNTSNTRLPHGDVERYFNAQQHGGGQGVQRHYANESVPGAYTAVTRDTFTGARPVNANRLPPAAGEQPHVPFTIRAPDIRPVPRSESHDQPRLDLPNVVPRNVAPRTELPRNELPRNVVPRGEPAMRRDRPVFDRPVMPVEPAQWPAPRRAPVVPQALPQAVPRQVPDAYRPVIPPGFSAPPARREAAPQPIAPQQIAPRPVAPSAQAAPAPAPAARPQAPGRDERRYDRDPGPRNHP